MPRKKNDEYDMDKEFEELDFIKMDSSQLNKYNSRIQVQTAAHSPAGGAFCLRPPSSAQQQLIAFSLSVLAGWQPLAELRAYLRTPNANSITETRAARILHAENGAAAEVQAQSG